MLGDIDAMFDDDDDAEIVEFLEYERRPYIVREREDFFHSLDDIDFFVRFRLKKITVLYILSLIEEELESVTDRNHSISPINQLLLTLRFYATGNFLLTVGDFIKVSKSSASKIVKKVSEAIATFSGRFIKMPSNDEEIRKAKSSFYEKAHVPRVIGSLDCTHIKIQRK
ncbi:unnamed protein product [Acanthoscelides obtectus]|uniref:Nuclease HARBI1 n=2 Tax=Acanthoscelides obtectus TaxID=200917 RepID=A0A9P0LIT7_ACAOB|nr:unnamed protein product [Acanthoscelides obtectus]CAH1980162.1 unnamed protein product [Acanthoscelides obtectus]CAH1984337.1 unnamed protein product [Acanthoscelides obtectus]CAH1993127.1 unnamed protein product [Acanthoscelides obtectus]CAH2001482.1 unnamed protein product [Acanthoscelides obtectus]